MTSPLEFFAIVKEINDQTKNIKILMPDYEKLNKN